MRTPNDAFALFGDMLATAPKERIAAAYIADDIVVGLLVVACGDECSALLPMASLLRYGVLRGADALLIAHNHPAGDPEPSVADLRATRRFAEAAAAIDMPLVDHIVVGRDGFRSLRLMGLL